MNTINPNLYTYSGSWPKWIVLHHTEELKLNDSSLYFDKPTFQTNKLSKTVYELDRSYLPYHFIVEKVGNTYNGIIGSPLLTKSTFLDIEDEHQEGIHIALMGNYNADKPDRKLYMFLAVKLIIPMIKAFKIPEQNIVLHSDISFFKNSTCPGTFFDIAILKSMVNNNMRKKSVTRR